MRNNNNYWLALICCLSVTVLSLTTKFENWEFMLKSDINVALWLLVAWMFDTKK